VLPTMCVLVSSLVLGFIENKKACATNLN